MIFDYLITLFRHLRKHWNTAVINILSYGLGIATCLILAQRITYDTSYDKFYNGYESIYRITLDNYYSGIYQNSTAHTFVPLGFELKAKYPEVQEFTTIDDRANDVVSVGDEIYLEKHIIAADVNYFKVFPHDMMVGSTEVVSPNDVFISERTAAKFFDDGNPIGNTMKIYSNLYTIKGVFRNLPANTHMKFDIVLIPPVRESNDWNVSYMYTYIKLKGDAKSFNEKLESFSKEYSQLADSQTEGDYTFKAKAQPLSSIHLESHLSDELEINGKMEDVYILLAIAIMILAITCFNYINITTTLNASRAKEAFIRKIHGASSRHSIVQHITESLVLNLFGFVVAILFLIGFINWDDTFSSSFVGIEWTNSVHYSMLAILFSLALILSGVLPALFFAYNIRSRSIHKTSLTNNINTSFVRNMAFVQFMISFILISGALVVLRQLKFMKEGDLGFTDKGVIAVEISPLAYRRNEIHFQKLKDDLEKDASIENVSFSRTVPGEDLIVSSVRVTDEPMENTQSCNMEIATSDYFNIYGIDIIAGRAFSEYRAADENTILINESLARKLDKLNFKNIVGKVVTVDYARRSVNFTVAGVVKDYYHASKKREVLPMLFIPLKHSGGVARISIKTSSIREGNLKSTEELVRKVLKENLTEANSGRGLDVGFGVIDVELNYNKQYSGEEQFSKFVNVLSVLAILMAGVGFFSLASTTIRKRTKEIAIRKVHGAKVEDVSFILFGYFLKLAGVAFIVSLPISYFLVQDWLNDFPLRIDIDSWFVLWPLIITTSLVLLSVSYHVLKVVIINPVEHLRNE
jgi:putative ABC transport system permease protein